MLCMTRPDLQGRMYIPGSRAGCRQKLGGFPVIAKLTAEPFTICMERVEDLQIVRSMLHSNHALHPCVPCMACSADQQALPAPGIRGVLCVHR